MLKQKWYVIGSQTTKGKYKQGDVIKFETETIKSSLCDYSDAFILVTGNITAAANNDTDVAFKNCAPFSTCTTNINDTFVDKANHIYIAVPMYSLIEYSDDYSDTLGSLWQFKRDEVPADNTDLNINNFQSFKYKTALLRKTADAVANTNSSVKEAKIVVPLKYFSNFSILLEMAFINCKVYLELNWIEDCILSSAGDTANFPITDTILSVPIGTLCTKDRSVYWNSYEAKPVKVIEQGKNLYYYLTP